MFPTLSTVTVQPASVHQVTKRSRISLSASLSASRQRDRKSTRLNSSHLVISYAVFCLKKKKIDTKAIKLTITNQAYFLERVTVKLALFLLHSVYDQQVASAESHAVVVSPQYKQVEHVL